MNRRKIITVILSALTILFAVASWFSLQSAVIVPDSSTWVFPMALFSAYAILICLDTMLIKEMVFLQLMLIGSLATSIFFAPDLLQIAGVLISSYFIYLASRRIRKDMDNNIKISPWKSLLSGKTYLLISLTFLVAMQYFIVMRSFDGEKKVPHFDASFITKKIAIPFIASVNPEFKVLKDETLTVDEFILQSQDSSQENELFSLNEEMIDSQLPVELTPQQREMIKKQAMENFSSTSSQVSQKNTELILSIGRKQFSDVAGVPVAGDEKISDIFTGLINNKINDYFNPKTGGEENNSVFPLILAVVLLIIIYPLSSILSIIWFLIAKLIILGLLKLKIFAVKEVIVSKEVIE